MLFNRVMILYSHHAISACMRCRPVSIGRMCSYSSHQQAQASKLHVPLLQQHTGRLSNRWHGWKLGKKTTSTILSLDKGEHEHHKLPYHSIRHSVNNNNTRYKVFNWLRERMITVFFPINYPRSVTRNYYDYSSWQFGQHIFGSIVSVLSTQALLHALGMGSEAVPLAAGVNWVLKDGLGQLGGVAYASLMEDRFDSDPKRFRFRSVVLLQLSCFLEMLTPFFPAFFLPFGALSNVGKNIAWLAGSATRAQLHKSLLLHDNMGDVTAKCTSQSIASGLIGTFLGALLSPILGSDSTTLFFSFVPLSIASLYCCYRSCRVAILPTLNKQRFCYLFDDISSFRFDESFIVPNPSVISAKEEFVWFNNTSTSTCVEMEPDLSVIPSSDRAAILNDSSLIENIEKRGYLVSIVEGRACLWFLIDASTRQELCGYYHVLVLRDILRSNSLNANVPVVNNILRTANEMVDMHFDEFLTSIQDAGWDTNVAYISRSQRMRRLRILNTKKDYASV